MSQFWGLVAFLCSAKTTFWTDRLNLQMYWLARKWLTWSPGCIRGYRKTSRCGLWTPGQQRCRRNGKCCISPCVRERTGFISRIHYKTKRCHSSWSPNYILLGSSRTGGDKYSSGYLEPVGACWLCSGISTKPINTSWACQNCLVCCSWGVGDRRHSDLNRTEIPPNKITPQWAEKAEALTTSWYHFLFPAAWCLPSSK